MRITMSFALWMAVPSFLAAQTDRTQAVASITAADISARVHLIAHDSMGGRETPSRGLDMTAAYIAQEFQRFGLKPGGDAGSYIQQYPIETWRPDTVRSSLIVSGNTFAFGHDVLPIAGGDVPQGVSGPVVFLTGVAERDPIDVRGKIVISALPADARGNLSRASRVAANAVMNAGAAAMIIVLDVNDDAWTALRGRFVRERTGVPWSRRGAAPAVFVREAAIGTTLAAARIDPAITRADSGVLRVRALPNVQVRLSTVSEVLSSVTAPNTVGILEGSDPVLRNEYIVFSAHMDHVGMTGAGRCRARGADSICNGADDDASGTVSVIELAEAFVQLNPRPKRSMIFLTVSGEEHGLWGSDYFAEHPPVPTGQLIANLNLDMVGRNWKDTIVVIGKEHSDLGATLNQVSARHPELNMNAIDDIWPQERFYFRSDHFNFARRGVPILFFFSGTHEDYHQATDHADKIDAEKQARLTKLVFYVGLEVANAVNRPVWDPESYRQIVQPSLTP